MASGENGNGLQALLSDINALGKRNYPEIGVPAFLIGEDCAGARPSYGVPGPLALHFGALAAIMSAVRSPLTVAEIGQLIELFADQHFLDGNGAPFSKEVARQNCTGG